MNFPPLILGDSTRLRQLMHNLIKNAFEAMAEDASAQQQVQITTRCFEISGVPFVSLVVVDDGPGFPEDMLERLFEPYVTTKNTWQWVRSGDCEKNCRRTWWHHSSRKCYRSRCTYQDSYTIEFSTDQQFTSWRNTGTQSRRRGMSQESILVVDDEPDIRNLVQEILVDEGYNVSVAENTKVARKHASSAKPDLVLLDIWMPGEDGISLLKDWQSSGSLHCPVVMMSGHGTVETAVEATRLGAYDFIEKPLTMAKLLVSVKRALESSDAGEEENPDTNFVEAPIGASLPMQALRDQAKKIAAHDNVVFIKGEAGVGKKADASYIHSLSARKAKRFTFLNEDNFNRGQAAATIIWN